MSKSTTALIGACLALLLAAAPALADPSPTRGPSPKASSGIARPLTPAPSLDLSSFGFARAPRRSNPGVATIVRPTPAPRLDASFCEDGRCSTTIEGRIGSEVVVRREKSVRKSVARRPRARPRRVVKNTNIIRVVVRRPRVVTTCSPCATTCDPCYDPCVDVCSDPCGPCDPCGSSCQVSDRMDTPAVFWSSGYHDGRSSCDPCDPCATSVCRPVCAPRRVRVVRCAPRRVCAPVCGPVCAPMLRVGLGFPCGGFGWGGGWGRCGGWGGGFGGGWGWGGGRGWGGGCW